MSGRQENVGAGSRPQARGGLGKRGDVSSSVGQPLSRVDGALKVRGKARFAAEVPFRNLSYGALTCRTIAKGNIT